MATQTTNIITIAEIKEYVDIADNLEVKYINTYISQAQEMFLRGLLGDALYAELQQQYPGDNFSYANIDLMQRVKPVLAFRFHETYMTHEGIYNTPMGMKEYTEDNSNPISEARRSSIKKYDRDRAEWYEKEMVNFLTNNKEDYPLYTSNCQPKPKRTFGISSVKRNERRGDVPPLGTGYTSRRNP